MSTRMQQRRGTAAQWLSTNNGNGPILAAGEIGYESDTNKFRIGDGVNHWIDLTSFIDEAALGGSLGDYVPLTDLAQPLGVATLDGSGKLLSSQIPNIDEISQDAINSALTAGFGISKEYDDALNIITIANTGVVSLHGTANQIDVSSTSGSVTASLAQDLEIPGTLKLSQDPVESLEAATKQYVDNISSGISFHEPVRVTTTENITLSGTQTIDGVALFIGDRVLVKNQIDAKENGIYDVASSTWSRSSDADNTPDGELSGGDFCLVLEGTVGAGYGYVCSNTEAVIVGTTEITYVPFNAGKTVQAGTGLWETAPGVISIDNTVATLEDTQTLKNKNISFADNSITSTIAQLNTAVSDADIATLAGTETLENKTLTAPVIDNGTITGTAIDSSSIKLSGVTVATTSDLSTHSSDTTNVHGIADTAALATMTYVDAAVGAIDLSPYSTLTGTETLSNKTLDNPTINAGSGYTVDFTESGWQRDSGGAYNAVDLSGGRLSMDINRDPSNTSNLNVGDYVSLYISGETTLNSMIWQVGESYSVGSYWYGRVDSTTPLSPGDFSTIGVFEIKKLTGSNVTISATEISYLDGVTSAIQTQLDAKATESTVQTQLDAKASSTDLSNHSSATTSVHGIADTSLLVTTTGTETLSNKTLSNPTITAGGTVVGVADSGNVMFNTFTDGYVSVWTTGDGLGATTLTISGSVSSDGDYALSAMFADGSFTLSAPATMEMTGGQPGITFTFKVASTVSSTEISYLDGVTSGIQAQLDAKAALAGATFTGDVTVETDLTVDGNLTISGTTTTVNTANLNVTDPMIYMGDGNSANLVDLGIVSAFNDGTYQHTGLVRDASAGTWKLFKGVTDEPTTVVNFAQGSLDDLAIGGLTATSITVGNVSNTEIGYLDGVTSAIQSQIDSKAPLASPALTGTPTAPTAAALTNTTQVATTAYVQEDNKVAYVSESGTSITMSQASHMFKTVHCTSSSAVTISIPTDASDNWPIGTYVNIRQMGTGQITVSAATPATTTLVATDSQFKTRVRYSEIVLEKIAANSWIMVGDTAA